MDELNRRKAVVFEHPLREDRDNPMNGIELVTDTTRMIQSLLYNATVVRCPDIKFVFSHGGGTIGSAVTRLGNLNQKLPKGVMYELAKLYYDCAGATAPSVINSYKSFVPVSHILFGTDYPFGNGVATAKGLRDNGGFSENELQLVERGNALELIPRLKTLIL